MVSNMYRVILEAEDFLVYHDERTPFEAWIKEKEEDIRNMASVFGSYDTVMPCMPKVGMELDLSGFVDLSSLPESVSATIKDEFLAFISSVMVCRDYIRVRICTEAYYKQLCDEQEV